MCESAVAVDAVGVTHLTALLLPTLFNVCSCFFRPKEVAVPWKIWSRRCCLLLAYCSAPCLCWNHVLTPYTLHHLFQSAHSFFFTRRGLTATCGSEL